MSAWASETKTAMDHHNGCQRYQREQVASASVAKLWKRKRAMKATGNESTGIQSIERAESVDEGQPDLRHRRAEAP